MRIPRIFQEQILSENQVLSLDQAASHYLRQVLRVEGGQVVDVFNHQGEEYRGVVAIQGKQVNVCLETRLLRSVESPCRITLAQAISRGEKMDFTLQKAVELGVHAIVPLMTARVGVKLEVERAQRRLAHWHKVIVSACEQSGRTHIPVVSPIQLFAAWLPVVKSEAKIILDPHVQAKPLPQTPPKEGVLLVGPEGGFSEEERELAYRAGFVGWRLGPRILRTETAGLSAMSVLQFLWGDLR